MTKQGRGTTKTASAQRLREALRPAANSRQFFTLARQCFNQNRRGASAYS